MAAELEVYINKLAEKIETNKSIFGCKLKMIAWFKLK